MQLEEPLICQGLGDQLSGTEGFPRMRHFHAILRKALEEIWISWLTSLRRRFT